MKHDDLVEALTALTDAVSSLESRLDHDIKAIDETLSGIQVVLGSWHSDQEDKYQRISQAVERYRESAKALGVRISRLEEGQRDTGAE